MFEKRYIYALQMRFSFVFCMENMHKGKSSPLIQNSQKKLDVAQKPSEKQFVSCSNRE